MLKKTMVVLMTLAIVLSACLPAAPTQEVMDEPEAAMMATPTEAMMEDETMMEDEPDAMMETPEADKMEKPTEAMMDDKEGEMMETPHVVKDDMGGEMMETPESGMMDDGMDDSMMGSSAWISASLTNVKTGEAFTIHDFTGKVVLVETMAVWCPSCKRQQEQVKALHEALGMDSDLVSVGLDIDPNENADDLKGYIETNGFDWIYAVAPADVAREIGALYGDQFLNPPSTPILIIDRKGQVHPMPFGIKSAEDLKAFIEPFLKDGM